MCECVSACQPARSPVCLRLSPCFVAAGAAGDDDDDDVGANFLPIGQPENHHRGARRLQAT